MVFVISGGKVSDDNVVSHKIDVALCLDKEITLKVKLYTVTKTIMSISSSKNQHRKCIRKSIDIKWKVLRINDL